MIHRTIPQLDIAELERIRTKIEVELERRKEVKEYRIVLSGPMGDHSGPYASLDEAERAAPGYATTIIEYTYRAGELVDVKILP